MRALHMRNKQRGSALAYALVIMTVVLIILVSMLGYITSQIKFSLNRVEREKAFQNAEAGIYFYRWYLAHETSGKTAQQIRDFWTSDPLGTEEGGYIADYGEGKYKIEVEAPDASSTIVLVKSTGWTNKMPNVERTVQVRFRRPSWSEYMWVINDFVQFGTEAEVYGKVHSNYGIRFDGLAHNVVSALPAKFKDPSHGGNDLDFGVHTHDNPADPHAPVSAPPWPDGTVPDRPDVFEAGRQFPVSEVSFNGMLSDLSNMKTESQQPNGTTINGCTASGCYFNYNTEDDEGKRIILKSDGTFDICTVADYHNTSLNITSYRRNSGTSTCSSCSGLCLQNYTIPNNGIIFVEGNAWVEGSVTNKKVTIAAANLLGGDPANIYIGYSNIRYASYDCDNIIGLVAQQDISIIRNCPDNFIVDAALLAQSGRIGRADYGWSGSKSTLTFNGALASYLKPYFNHGTNGFGERVYNFDNNLLYCPPPYFPTGTEYAIDLWEEL